jgi:predicted TIM-barrel fold metal-dependent hydrolase
MGKYISLLKYIQVFEVFSLFLHRKRIKMNNSAEKQKTIIRVIALEEAFLHPKLRALYKPSYVEQLDLIKDRLTDVGPERIKLMDAAGIDLQVLSHVSPGVQTLDRETAIRLSIEINDWLFGAIKEYPTRFAAFAMLPTQSPTDAAAELERTVRNYGFKGALINGHTNGIYLDDDSFAPLLECAQTLDVPIYIHPTDPPRAVTDIYYKGYPAMVTGGWGWQVETGTHLLRMMCGGVFDRYPGLKIIVGHMGELIPYNLQRINKALTLGNWLIGGGAGSTGGGGGTGVGGEGGTGGGSGGGDGGGGGSECGSESEAGTLKGMQKSVYYYMRKNVFITTSGVFDHAALNCAVAGVGIDNILFSIDYPFGDNFEAMVFLRTAQLSPGDKEKLASGNAERLLRLSVGGGGSGQSSKAVSPGLSSGLFTFKARIKSKLGRMILSFLVK